MYYALMLENNRVVKTNKQFPENLALPILKF